MSVGPPAVISNSSRRFWAQQASVLSLHSGRSSPKLVVSMRAAAFDAHGDDDAIGGYLDFGVAGDGEAVLVGLGA